MDESSESGAKLSLRFILWGNTTVKTVHLSRNLVLELQKVNALQNALYKKQ